MKIHYNYFKAPATRKRRAAKLAAYVKAMDARCAAMPPLTLVVEDDHAMVSTAWGFMRVGVGNTKVFFPTLNFESGLTCSSAGHCDYSYGNKRALAAANKNLPVAKRVKGKPLCYAQKLEGARPSTFHSKVYQAMVVERIATTANPEQQQEVAFAVTAAALAMKGRTPYIRVSEVGDIGPVVADFALMVLTTMVDAGLKPYLYTKRGPDEQAAMRAVGATVLVSDTDFVCVDSAADAAAAGLPVCPGECGGSTHQCFRCPLGKTTAVIGH